MTYTHSQTVFNQIFSIIKVPFNMIFGQLENTGRNFDLESLFKILLFAQVTWRESLRDIETWLQTNENKLYHTWLKSFARSTVSYWNNKDNNWLFEKVFYKMYELYNSTIWKHWDSLWISCVAMDSSLISLSLSMFDRAKYRTAKWWVRIHVWLDISQYLPRFCVITEWKKWDNKIARQIVDEWRIKKWEMIVFDRYYVDFDLWNKINDNDSFFITRTKTNTLYNIIENYDTNWDWITLDAKIELSSNTWKNKYQKYLRIVRFYNKEDWKIYEYITNNFELSAIQIANIYKNRWQIETFFRWIKQNLKIKTFLGTSENAVKNQIRIALIYFVILKYLTDTVNLWKKQILKFIRVLSDKIFERIVLTEIYAICKSKKHCCMTNNVSVDKPPWLFDI